MKARRSRSARRSTVTSPTPRQTRLLVIAGVAAALAAASLLLSVGMVAAADSVTFGTPTASSKFGDGITFAQPLTVSGSVERVEILLASPGAVGPTVEPVSDANAGTMLEYHLDLSNGQAVPNTPFTATWRVILGDGRTLDGPALQEIYADDRFVWKTLAGTVVRVHWTEGDDAFGRRALKIGDDAVANTSQLLGVTETRPIDFFIYADQPAFYAALGPGTRENVGGQAHADIRTLFALITPDEINASWVSTVVPHELTHVVFQTAVDNPYHDPPHWLNEGLAVYLSAGYQDSDRRQVEGAAKAGAIIPFDGLVGAFPTEQARFFLAYAESVSAVDRIVRVYGRPALVALIRSYAKGVSDDDAFQAALGRNLEAFEADWLAEIGAKPPSRVGPRAAPAGPLPAGWTGPRPDPSFDVTGPLPEAPSGNGGGLRGDPIATILAPSAGILGIVVLLVVAVAASRRARGRSGVEGDPEWNRVFGRSRRNDDPAVNGDGWMSDSELRPRSPRDSLLDERPTGIEGSSDLRGIHFGPESSDAAGDTESQPRPSDGSEGEPRPRDHADQ